MGKRLAILRTGVAGWLLALALLQANLHGALHNERYRLNVEANGDVRADVAGLPSLRLTPEFTVLWSVADPHCSRNASHPNYAVAPRTAVRWRNQAEPLESLNAWLALPETKLATTWTGTARDVAKSGRIIEFRDAKNKVTVTVAGDYAFDTTQPFTIGTRVVLRPTRTVTEGNRIVWEFPCPAVFDFKAELTLPPGQGDPQFVFTLTPRQAAYFSVAYTGAPATPLKETLPVPQECETHGHKQFNYVMCEADLHLPRAHVATKHGNLALAVDPRECRFCLPNFTTTRFGCLLQHDAAGLKPVLLAPLLGGPESQMAAGKPWRFGFTAVVRPGDWKETYVHLARNVFGFRDQRDNSGPGSLNGTLERVMDFLSDHRGGNHALWDPQQKYYDYFTDKTGVYKPFSALPGLSAAIITDDEDFFRRRARPAVEYALSRRTSVFAPYDTADNKQARTFGRPLGAPYPGYAQLIALHELLQQRVPAVRAMADAKEPAREKISDLLARWQIAGDTNALAAACQLGRKALKPTATFGEEEFFDLLDLADATRDPALLRVAVEAAYHNVTKLNLYPMPPDTTVTVDRGGKAPIHLHSFGRHHNIWGFPPPQPLSLPEQTVPAWRIARLGVTAIAYPMEFWMNTHGAILHTAGLAHDAFLRDVARWGMVGRFGNFPGDNRSQDSLVGELPDAVDRKPWDWNFATVNAGHAWDFAGEALDFLVTDAFERSDRQIYFPAVSDAGSNFRVRIYGAKAGTFYGDANVRLWLPRGLLECDNRQFDWLAAYGNGQLYLALWNQSFREEHATFNLNPALAECQGAARVWRDNAPAPPLRLEHQRATVTIAPKGILALAIPATVKPRLQAQLFDASLPPFGPTSFTNVDTAFGPVHATLLSAGPKLTSAFVYAEAFPEKVIAARLHWRQGDGPWQQINDDIFPYEFSPELNPDAGNFACVFEVEDAQQKMLRSPLLTLSLNGSPRPTALPPAIASTSTNNAPAPAAAPDASISEDFFRYLQKAANGSQFGLRADGKFYPYSTPLGRRVGWRQPVWDKSLYAHGCTRAEADAHFRAAINTAAAELQPVLARQQINFSQLDRRQQETLLDFAVSESASSLSKEFLAAVLAKDWDRLVNTHLYIRYAAHAPDHPRNKAFAQRWEIP